MSGRRYRSRGRQRDLNFPQETQETQEATGVTFAQCGDPKWQRLPAAAAEAFSLRHFPGIQTQPELLTTFDLVYFFDVQMGNREPRVPFLCRDAS